MLNLNKEAKALEVCGTQLTKCPVCEAYVLHQYFMQDSKTKVTSKWYSCSCGVVFQSEWPKAEYDKKYWDKYAQFDSKLREAYQYPVRIYSPIIEELIYGRKVLLVGRVNSHQEDAFAERGWVPYSIDLNESAGGESRVIIGDFEDHPFPPAQKFNLIWLYQTLECFKDPVKALQKAQELLTEDGIIFIASPDSDFIHTRSSSSFIHWKPEMNYLMWNRRSLTSQLEKLGFNVILSRQNYEHRFPFWDDLHLIAQRKFF